MRVQSPSHSRLSKKLTLLLVIALLLSACGGAAPASSESSVPEATAAATSEAASTEEAASEEATSEESASLFPLTITDAAGVEFTFDAPPKIGCWWAGCNEMLADLGVVPHASSYTDENATSVFNFPAGTPPNNIEDSQNPEEWAAAEVDLVLMRVPVDPAQEPIKAAAPIFYLHHPSYGESSQQGYAAFEENLRLVGQLTGQPEAADAAIARFDTVLENLRALSTPETQALSVAVLFQGDGYRVIGPGNPFCVALAEAQLGQCVGEGAASYEINAEEFLGLDPDWLVYQSGDASYQDRTDPVWSELTAVKEGRVYDAGGNRYYCCSTRGLIHALQEYVSHVLPEAGIPDPGPHLAFDPLQSPLLQPAAESEGATSEASESAATGETREVTHALGTVIVPADPQRVVALGSSEIEVLAALGIKPVGFAAWIGAGNNVQVPAHISAAIDLSDAEFLGDEGAPNLELLVALQPDLIVINGGGYNQELYDQVSQIAPTVAYSWWPEDSDKALWQEYFINTATALGKAEEAQQVVADWQARITEFKAAADSLDDTQVSVVRLMPDQLRLYFKGSYSGTILEEAGVLRVASQDVVDFAETITLERILDMDGDILLLAQSDPQATIYNQMTANPLWQQLQAVQGDRVYLVNHDVWIGGGGFVAANLILDDLEKLFLEDGAGLEKPE